MLTCEKIYRDIPLAHRLPLHQGRCRFFHGHNWTIKLSFSCRERDENGFVVDFGSLGYIEEWISNKLDHSCLILDSDHVALSMIESYPDLFRPYIIEDGSTEGLAAHLWEQFSYLIYENEGSRVWISRLSLRESSANSAFFYIDQGHSWLEERRQKK